MSTMQQYQDQAAELEAAGWSVTTYPYSAVLIKCNDQSVFLQDWRADSFEAEARALVEATGISIHDALICRARSYEDVLEDDV